MAEIRKIKINPGETIEITCEEVQPTPHPEPTPTPTPDNGKPMYKVGKISDAHFDIEDSHNSEYLEDLKNALRYYERHGVTHIDCNGDLCQYKDKDLIAFREAYDSKLPFFTVMGNHDYLRIYETKDASHQVPTGYKDFEDLWYQTVQSLACGADVHYFGTTFKDHLNFFFERNGDLHVFISVDYGASFERYDVIRAVNRLDYDDPNVKLMTEYVKDTPYDRKRETNFDYRFYNPAALVWLKNILEANPKKRVFLNMHHFSPNGSGDTDSLYRNLRIWPVPTSQEILDKYYSGSNTLCGLEFWFIEKLLRLHLNVICFGGHSHRRAKAQEDVITRAYHVTQPNGDEVTPLVDDLKSLSGTKYDYKIYRYDGHSYADTAPTVHLPSLAKPSDVDGSTLYGASEGVLMECHEDKVVINYIRFKTEGSDKYTNETIKTVTLAIPNDQSPVVEPEQPTPSPEPAKTGITIRFINRTGEDIRFAGKFLPYNQEEQYAMPFYLCAPQTVDDYCHWTENNYSLKNGETKTFTFTELTDYAANKGKLIPKKISLSTIYGKHFRTADSAKWPSGIPAIKFGVRSYGRHDGGTGTGPAMIHAVPITQDNCLIKEGGVYDVILDKIKDNATLDKSYINIPYKDGDKYKYVIL